MSRASTYLLPFMLRVAVRVGDQPRIFIVSSMAESRDAALAACDEVLQAVRHGNPAIEIVEIERDAWLPITVIEAYGGRESEQRAAH